MESVDPNSAQAIIDLINEAARATGGTSELTFGPTRIPYDRATLEYVASVYRNLGNEAFVTDDLALVIRPPSREQRVAEVAGSVVRAAISAFLRR